MYLLNAVTTIQWDILPTDAAPALSELCLHIEKPDGTTEFIESAIEDDNYVIPTDTTLGTVTYDITPEQEGFWRIRLVTGSASSYQILSKVEMYVFDNTTVTTPYSDTIGSPTPYDINFYMQGYVVEGETYGVFVASRDISISENAEGSTAYCEETAEYYDLTLNILHNDTQIGTVTFTTEASEGVFEVEPAYITSGDRVKLVVAAGTADERIRDIGVNLVGCCTVVPCTVM